MNKLSPTLAKVASATGLLLGAFTLSVLASSTWAEPGCAAPGCNVDAPINVGAIAQHKEGFLSVGKATDPRSGYDLDVNGSGLFKGLLIEGLTSTDTLNVGGSAKIEASNWNDEDYVLANDGEGNAKWTDPSALISSGSGKAVSDINNTPLIINFGTAGVNWVDIGLSTTITPTSASSKILLNANVVASNGNSTGQCEVGLFKDGVELVAPFASIDESNWNASPSGITYLDTPGSVSPVTYSIKARIHSTACFINRSDDKDAGGTYVSGVSTMTAVQI